MASIVLSFVGQQDPVSDTTRDEGSIVTLLHHLVSLQQSIKQVILLYTEGTQDRAELTQGWLEDAPLHLPSGAIALIPVGSTLSQDPVNLLLAVQAARQGLDSAARSATPEDTLELNASSGTPVMKSAWSVLQAAGYASRSRVWQVRNPKEMKPDQQRVFQTNVDALKREFDLTMIKRQVHDYNYSGALATLTAAAIESDVAIALLKYAHCRFALDFDRAFAAIAPLLTTVDKRWNQDIAKLRNKGDRFDLLREAYFNAQIEYRNQQYADFLITLSQFQEGVLNELVSRYLGRDLPSNYGDCDGFWQFIQQFDQGTLYAYLQRYQFRGGLLTLHKFLNRPVLVAILEYAPQFAAVLTSINALSQACDRRNKVIHNFEGISQIDDADQLLHHMRQILKQTAPGTLDNPFDELNQQLCALLDKSGWSQF